MTRTTRIASILIAILILTAIYLPAAGQRAAFQLVTNESFEAQNGANPSLSPWTLKTPSGDKIACNDKAPSVQHGVCAFMFKGSIGESARLIQRATNLDMMNTALVQGPGSIDLQFKYYSDKNASSLDARVKVKYTMPGNPTVLIAKKNSHITGKSDDGGSVAWVGRGLEQMVTVPQSATILSVKYIFSNTSTAGKLFIDEVYGVFYTS
ncbi:MAG: hypothetical protein IPK52_08175 [Chloroflexi bacterium]|nr:hypothetical protein [Chloroflexota bacterium]